MAKKVYVGVKGKNIFKATENTGKSHIGVTYSCDEETQEYTLNGTTTNTGDLILESNLDLDWEIGTPYTVTIIQTGGTAVLGAGNDISYSFSIFANNNTSYLRGSLSNTEFSEVISFTGNAIADTTGGKFAFYLQLWRIGTVFENYKFKIQIEKGSASTEYMPYNKSFASVVKKIYVGIENVARKVKKGFIGIGGIARQFFSSERKLSYYGELDAVSGRYAMASTSFNNLALFAGGRGDSDIGDQVIGYSKSLVKYTYTNLSDKKYLFSGASTSKHAIFAGGINIGTTTRYKTVDAYDINLTKVTGTDLRELVSEYATASMLDKVIIAGGKVASFETTEKAQSYDLNLTRTDISNLENAVSDFAGTSVGNYFLLFGGRLGSASGSVMPNITIYDKNLTKLSYTWFEQKRYSNKAASTKKYAFFGPGRSDTSVAVSNVDAMDTSLVKHTVANTSVTKANYAAVGFEDYVIFSGGENENGAHKTVEAYDDNLVRYSLTDLSVSAACLGGAVAGDYAIFVAGESSKGMGTYGNLRTTVNAYQVI